jgi:murein DD-endopeptidase MepM/ murein hydrolase activator NlpD
MRVAPLLVLAVAVGLSACSAPASGVGAPNGWGARPVRTPSGTVAARPAPARPPRPAPERPSAIPSGSALLIPVVGIAPDRLRDSFHAPRSGGRVHQAIDIAAPTGTPLLAITDGTITRKHWNALGGNTLYLTSADGRYDFYYAHLHTYADGVEVGTRVRRGDVVGTVGATGNAQGPHLHLQVLDRSGSGRGTPVNPYTLLRAADYASAL